MSSHDDTLNWLLDRLPADELIERYNRVDASIRDLIRTRNILQMAIEARNQAYRLGAGDDAGDIVRAPLAGDRPGSTDAIRRILMDAPYRTLTVQEIMRELNERGWMPVAKDPRKAVGATLSRMVHRTEELEPMGRARYRLREAIEPSAGTSANGSQATAGQPTLLGSAGGEAASDSR